MTTPIITFSLPIQLYSTTNWVRKSGSIPSHRGQLSSLFDNLVDGSSIGVISMSDLRDDDCIIPICKFGEYLIAVNVSYMLADKQKIATNYKAVTKQVSITSRELIAIYLGYGDPKENIYYMSAG